MAMCEIVETLDGKGFQQIVIVYLKKRKKKIAVP